jgi:hypothetical protein
MTGAGTGESRLSLIYWVRWYVPIAVIVGGALAYLLDPSIVAAEGAAGVVGAGLAWLLFGWLFRKGVEGEADRDAEDAAREYLDRHGEWPTDEQTAYFVRHGRWPEPPAPPRPAPRPSPHRSAPPSQRPRGPHRG